MRNFGALGYTGIRRSILAEAALHNYESPIYLQHDVGYPYSTYGSPSHGFNLSLGGSGSTDPGMGYSTGQPGSTKYDSRAAGFTAAGNVLSSLVTGIFGARAAQAGAGGQTVVYQEPAGPNWGLILGGVAVTGVLVTGLVLALRK
jgi:hypothetical protein